MHEYLSRLENVDELIRHYFLPFTFKIIGAFAIWMIGSFFVKLAQKLILDCYFNLVSSGYSIYAEIAGEVIS